MTEHVAEKETPRDIATRRLAFAFNEWMRRYTDEPERFTREFQTVGEFLMQEANGEKPSYGASCAAYLASILDTIPNNP